MDKKIAVVTGATSGIGYETALGLAKLGFCVVMACRNPEKAAARLAEIKTAAGNDDVHAMQIDMASFKSIKSFAREYLSKFTRLDVLINNAGIYSSRKQLTEDGFETTMGVNYMGHYLLTRLLQPLIMKTQGARIINTSSAAGLSGRINLKKPFNGHAGFRGYCASKLAQIWFTIALAAELKDTGVSVYAVHPGWGATGIFKGEYPLIKFVGKITEKYAKSPAECAKTSIWLASADKIGGVSGMMFADQKPFKYNKRCVDAKKIQQFMFASTQATGV